jgi:hypothetical protein
MGALILLLPLEISFISKQPYAKSLRELKYKVTKLFQLA